MLNLRLLKRRAYRSLNGTKSGKDQNGVVSSAHTEVLTYVTFLCYSAPVCVGYSMAKILTMITRAVGATMLGSHWVVRSIPARKNHPGKRV